MWSRRGIGNVVELEVPRRNGRGSRGRLIGVLHVKGRSYVGHPNGDVGWTRDLEAAVRHGIVRYHNGVEWHFVATRLPIGEEREQTIRATGQHPFPGQSRLSPRPSAGCCRRRLLPTRRRHYAAMKLLQRVIGPDRRRTSTFWPMSRSREAIAIDTATPCVEWLTTTLAERGWTLKLIVSTHRHWDHIGDNAPLSEATGAQIAAHMLDRHGLENPSAAMAPFPIPPSVPAVDLAEGSRIKFGEIDLEVLHTPGHTEGSVCLLASGESLLFTGDTLFAGSWGRTDLPGGSDDQMVASLARLSALPTDLKVLPGHGRQTTLEAERPWLDQVVRSRVLPF